MTRSLITRRAAVGGFALLALSGCSFSFGNEKDTPEGEDRKKEGEDRKKEGEDPKEEDLDSDSEEKTGEGSDDGDDADNAEETETEADPEDESESDGAGAEAGSEGTEVQIGKSFSDADLGDKFTLISAKRDNPTSIDAGYVEDGGEVVYLQFKFTPSGEWGGAISTNEFYIVVDGVEDRAKSGLNGEIGDAGLTPLELPARADGASGPLWAGFTATTRQKTYKAAYIRPATEVIGEDRTLPEFRYDFEIPAP